MLIPAMGIPRLRRHVNAFSEPVLLASEPHNKQTVIPHVQSVVIDGPSLVYHVFWRLMSWSDENLGFPGAQPTCDEVSCGVMTYLLLFTILGVKIERICFDGALPLEKRETRLSRLEKSRRKLELLRCKSQCYLRARGCKHAVSFDNISHSRTLPVRHTNIPENPFIVPAVLEDLKNRWNKENILDVARLTLGVQSIGVTGFPWANVAIMVPGEADIYCVCMAKQTGSSILTNDSDLLLYDLGAQGSVISLDSIEIIGYHGEQKEWQMKALRLSPTLVARRLGIPNMQHFAFQLKTDPNAGTAELVRRSKNYSGDAPEYQLFIHQYQSETLDHQESMRQTPQDLDARVSELFCQYELPQTYLSSNAPRMYLAILPEDHAKRCAWVEGRLYRKLAYSILNASRPDSERSEFVNEYTRRGGRIAVDKIVLRDKKWIVEKTNMLVSRLKSIHNILGGKALSPGYWIMFSLCELYCVDPSHTFPDSAQLRRFFTVGHMGEKLEWSDIHFSAQIQSILYSLRILNQLLRVSTSCDSMENLGSILADLPPLRVMMEPVSNVMKECLTETVSEFVDQFLRLLEKEFCIRDGEKTKINTPTTLSPAVSRPEEQHQYLTGRQKTLRAKTDNIYDILAME
ncbi:XPG domain containing-domain-containing protein [Aspergillus avenaceus]|uniref:XPG domain containing-domain-containing protein n=1 Tax=Aspergillus avenaceus TaxID=36643 RepID=A0A5N6TDI5_ASPAV|nr:XPG domain containing-domain-containing protein [Aspergillus avenaceus]